MLSTAAHSGTQAGCGDCVWELIPACPKALPGDPNGQDASCAGPSTAKCAPGQLAFRLYLSTAAVRNELVSVLCLGGINDVIPVGDIAAGDVQRYLKDVTPPDLTLKVQPDNGVPAGLPAYFWVRPPAMTPAPFGNGQVAETITIKPMRYRWTWGDGDATGWTTDAGAPYPDGTLTHTYLRSAHYRGDVVAEWGGTYTITVAGQTYGPYDAIGTVTKQQPFAVTVLKAHSTLVSHG